MPSYPLTFPTNVAPEHVRVRRRTPSGMFESPTSLVQQIYQHPGARWEIEVTLQAMPADKAALWTQFLHDLDGRAGTFELDLTPYCPGLDPAPGTTTFRLADSEVGWDARRLQAEYGFGFRAVEDL